MQNVSEIIQNHSPPTHKKWTVPYISNKSQNLVVEMKNGATKLGNINYIYMAFEFRPLHVLVFIF